MGNTSSQPDLSQRDRLQSSKSTSRVQDFSAEEIPPGFSSLPYSTERQEIPETQLRAEQADDIAASSQLLEESLRWMENGTTGVGEGYSRHVGDGDAVAEHHRQGKRKRRDEGEGEEKRGKKRKRKSGDGSGGHGESADGMEEHAMQVDMVTGELPAHLRTNRTSKQKRMREKNTEMVDVDGVRDDWMLQLDGAADGTLTDPVQRKGPEGESSRKGGKEKMKHVSRQNIDDTAAEPLNPTKSEKRTSAESSTSQGNAAVGRSEGNGVLTSPRPADGNSVSPLKGNGRKVRYVRIPAVRYTQDVKASASRDALPAPHYGSNEQEASGVAHGSVKVQSSSQRRKDKRDKKAKKPARNLASMDANTQDVVEPHAGVILRSPPKEQRGLTPKWTAVNHQMPTGLKSTVQSNHVDDGSEACKQGMSSPASKPSLSAKEPSISVVAGAQGKVAKQRKSPKSKEFIYESDLSNTEESSKIGVSREPKKAHAVTPQQVQAVATSKKESKKRKKRHRMSNGEDGQKTNEAKKIDLAVGSNATVGDAAKTTPKSNRKRKRIAEVEDEYAIPPDSDNEPPQTTQPKSTTRPGHNHPSQRSDQGKAEETDDMSAEKVKGAFSQSEISVLTRYFNKYKTEHSLDQRSMNEMIQNTERSNETKAFWDEIANLLPNRPRKSLQRFCRRQWHNYQSSGTWSPEEDEILRETYAFKPNKWVYIGGVVGRRPEDCRDRWRNVVKLGDRRKEGVWTEEEEESLTKAVEECAKAMIEARRKSGANEVPADAEAMELLDWNVVSDKMGGTRSRQQCADKWKRMARDAETTAATAAAEPEVKLAGKGRSRSAGWRRSRASRRYKMMLAGDKYDILKAVWNSGTVNVGNIRWSIVREILGGKDCMWEKADLEYAFGVVKRKAGLDGQEEKLGLKQTVKKMKRYLKGKFGKEAVGRRFVDTEEGKRVRECGWSSKTPEKRKTVVEKLQYTDDEDVDGAAQDEVVQDDDVQDEDVLADQRGLDDQDEVDGQEVDEQEVDGQEVAEQDVLSQEVDSVLSADDYT